MFIQFQSSLSKICDPKRRRPQLVDHSRNDFVQLFFRRIIPNILPLFGRILKSSRIVRDILYLKVDHVQSPLKSLLQ